MNETLALNSTRQEILTYTQIITFLLLLGVFVFIAFQVLLPQTEWIDLGTLADLEQDTPTHQIVKLRDRSELSVWVVYANEQWFVFDGWVPRVPLPSRTRCQYEWQRVNERFEDPCSGVKFSRTGEFLNTYNQFEGRQVQNLDRYSISIRDQHLFINVTQIIHAEPFIAPFATSECCSNRQ